MNADRNTALPLALRGMIIFIGLVALWWLCAWAFDLPPYILPTPDLVAQNLISQWDYLLHHSLITLGEILAGLFFGLLCGVVLALILISSRMVQNWLLPVLIVSQAIPFFALAPILVLWFDFGMTSKIIIAVLIIFFPVTTSFFDGLRRTDTELIELARTMGASSFMQLLHVRLIAALPAFGSGLRIAAVFAPLGAIIGEWVGASGGLGYVMLQANGRMQIALCFAAVFILALITLSLWKIIDMIIKKMLYWIPQASSI